MLFTLLFWCLLLTEKLTALRARKHVSVVLMSLQVVYWYYRVVRTDAELDSSLDKNKSWRTNVDCGHRVMYIESFKHIYFQRQKSSRH